MKRISLAKAARVARKLGVDLRRINLETFRYALEHELEHGTINILTNITNDDPMITGKLALAHLLQYPNYYQALRKMDKKLEKYWKGRTIPNILED